MRTTRRHALMLAAGAIAAPSMAHAQAWPSRPVRFIIPFPPGGAADIVGRILAAHFQQALGQPFVVENRGGAGSTIGVDALAKAAPDGYTIGMINIAANAIVPAVRRQPLPYRPIEDFAPISNLAVTPALLLINPQKLPNVNTVADLVAAAAAAPPSTATACGAGGGPVASEAATACAAPDEAPEVAYAVSATGGALTARTLHVNFERLAGLHGDADRLSAAAARLPFWAHIAHTGVVVDTRLGNVLWVDAALVVQVGAAKAAESWMVQTKVLSRTAVLGDAPCSTQCTVGAPCVALR